MPQSLAENSSTMGTPEAALVETLGNRTLVLVGMMGAGKSSVGRKLALRLPGTPRALWPPVGAGRAGAGCNIPSVL